MLSEPHEWGGGASVADVEMPAVESGSVAEVVVFAFMLGSSAPKSNYVLDGSIGKMRSPFNYLDISGR